MRAPILIAALATALAAAGPGLAQSGYSLTGTVALGAPDRWDYLTFDPASHRVYVAHGDRISVVDSDKGQVVGEVLGAPGGTHGIGLSGGKGYTDDGEAGQVIVFDPASFKVLKRIAAKPDADGIAVDPKTGHVFVIEGDSHTVQVVDPASDTIIATIDGGGGLEFGAASPDGKVYVNGAERREILRIDTATNQIDARWPIAACQSPHGLALDAAGHRLFSTCKNKLMVILDTDSGQVVGTAPIGVGTDAAAFDPLRHRAFSSNGDGTVSVIAETGPASFTALPSVATAPTGRTMTVDPQTGRLFVAAAEIDKSVPVVPGPGGRPGKPKLKAGSLKLLMLDPAS